MKVKEVAEIAGISVRTLHYYDEIGLLVPDKVTEVGYREYSDENLVILQQILFFRALDFPLKKIKEIIESPTFERHEALELQHRMLLDKKRRLEKMIETIEKTLQHSKGEIDMSKEEQFAGFDFSHNPYEQEARERWGDKAVDKANEKAQKMTPFDEQRFNDLFRELASLRHLEPESIEAQKGIEKWYQYLNELGDYSYAAFEGLGQLYTEDKRFTANIDQYGDGLAVFMREAMAVYAHNHQ